MNVDKRLLKRRVLYDNVLKILKHSLGSEHADALSVLAVHVCDEQSEIPLHKVLHKLFHHAYTIPQLLSVLLQCESPRMQRLFSGHSSLPLERQFDELKYVLHYFNALQDAVLDVGKDYLLQAQAQRHQEEVGDEADIDRQSSIEVDPDVRKSVLHASVKQWSKEKKIRLYNFFKGVPIHATVDVTQINSKDIHLKLSADLMKVFASQSTGRFAYAICADEKDQVKVSISEVLENSVILKLEEVSPSLLHSRKNIGVRTMNEVPVLLKVRSRTLRSVVLRDISSTGLGFSLPEKYHALCQNGKMIECNFKLADKDVNVSGWIRWVMVMNGEMRMGMELRPNVAVQQALQKEVFRIQRQIILSLNDLDMPKIFSQS
ncbi:MAG: PilZ domain-containing protein [Mariprofundaceae bacterium]|nr:PilZ domain-containing protein [Mariprofundaceae bacterium]